jgi:hypothetical protein
VPIVDQNTCQSEFILEWIILCKLMEIFSIFWLFAFLPSDQLRTTRLGQNFALDFTSFMCAGGKFFENVKSLKEFIIF